MVLIFFHPMVSEAHIVGVMPWCLANSPVHFECFHEDRELCEKTAQKRTTAFERWNCVPFPVDFRKIPKSGEGNATSENAPQLAPPKKNLKETKDKFDL